MELGLGKFYFPQECTNFFLHQMWISANLKQQIEPDFESKKQALLGL